MEEVARLIDQELFGEAISAIDKLLVEADEDNESELIRAKAVLLVLEENFVEALKLLNTTDGLVFERAYSQYRLGKYQAALDSIEGKEEGDPRLYTLKAQVLYRLNRYSESHQLYRTLLSAATEDDERLIVNCNAAHALDIESTASPVSVNASSETQFNYACHLAGHGDYEQALDVIDTAIQWAKEVSMDDSADNELRQFYLQKAFILSKTNHLDKAKTLLKSISPAKDAMSLLAQFNCHVGTENETVSREAVGGLLQDGKLNPLQRQYALLNLAVVSIKENRLRAAARILRKLVKVESLKGIATSLLLRVLQTMGSVTEIKKRSEECEMMKIAVDLDRVLRGDKKEFLEQSLKYPGMQGVLYSANGKTYPARSDAFKANNLSDTIKILNKLEQTRDVKLSLRICEILNN
jgi:tetratricopeptide (TPR) repeat protein